MRRRAALVLLGSVLGLSVAATAAQRSGTPQQRSTFRAGVELVQVDVLVLDGDGKPVTGLTAEDFTVFDRGRPRPVISFVEVAHTFETDPGLRLPAGVRSDVADNSSAQSERVVILVIDDINIWIERADLARRLAHRVVDELGPDASMAVVFTSGRDSVEVTQDRAILHDAIDRFTGAYHAFRVSGACGPGNFQACQMPDALEHVAKMIGAEGDQRRKAVVVLSEWQAADTRGLFDVGQPREAPIGSSIAYASGGGSEAFAGMPSFVPNYNEIELLQMMRAFHRSNVTFYGIDPRGRLQTTQERMRESRSESPMLRMDDPLFISQQTLMETAEATGGFAIVNTDDLDEGLDRIVADLDHYYLLGFYPEDPADNRWHDLQVQVGLPSLTIRHRRGYQIGGEPEPPKNSDPMVALSAGVLPRTGLPLRIFAAPAARRGNDARVAVTAEVRVPADAIARPGGRLEDTVSLTVLAVDLGRRKVTRSARQRVDVVVPRSRVLPNGDVTYQVVLGLDLPPASYQIRVSAESARLDKAGSVYLTTVVPDVSKARVAIAGPTIGFAPGTRAAAGVTMAEDGLLAAGLDPVLDRIFTPADTLRVQYAVWRRDAKTPAPTRLEVLDADGRVVFARDGADVVAGRGAPPGPGMDVEIPLAGLPPGAYRVKITAGSQDVMAEQEVGFAVRSSR